MALTVNINGETLSVEAEADTPLLWVIRDEMELTGTKFGCGVAACGACTVLVDGIATRSCQTFVGDLEDAKVTTIEGVTGPVAKAVQQAWQDLDVVQCGYCQSGQIMSAISLLNDIPKPSDEDIDSYMSGNACRCATYQRIRAAIHQAAGQAEG